MSAIINDTSTMMSIEEYRDLKLTPEQEWNSIYNPKRVSIEALQTIEINKKGKGPLKNVYHLGCIGPGPYYDPHCTHVHIWKKKDLIDNFNGEQFHNIPYIQYTENKPGLYCSVCHCRSNNFYLKWNQKIETEEEPSILDNNNVYKQDDFLPQNKIKVFPKCDSKVESFCELLGFSLYVSFVGVGWRQGSLHTRHNVCL